MQAGEGARLENLVAVSLLKHVYKRIDEQAENCALHYIRTKDGAEIDFALTKDDDVESFIEVKTSDAHISGTLAKFHTKHCKPAVQLVQHIRNPYHKDGVQVLGVKQYLQGL